MNSENTLSTENIGLQKYGVGLLVAGIAIFIIQSISDTLGDIFYWVSLALLLLANLVLLIDAKKKGETNNIIKTVAIFASTLIALIIIQLVMKVQYPPPF